MRPPFQSRDTFLIAKGSLIPSRCRQGICSPCRREPLKKVFLRSTCPSVRTLHKIAQRSHDRGEGASHARGAGCPRPPDTGSVDAGTADAECGRGHRRAARHHDHRPRPGGRLRRRAALRARSRRRARWPTRCAPAGCCSAASATALPLPGFDLGNSPREYTCARCKGTTLVLTTTNGTRALLRAAAGRARSWWPASSITAPCANNCGTRRVLFISSAPAATARSPWRTRCWPGALVDFLCEDGDGASQRRRPAGLGLLRESWPRSGGRPGGQRAGAPTCAAWAMMTTSAAAARVDQFALVPELRRDPLRVEVGAVGIVKSHWPK